MNSREFAEYGRQLQASYDLFSGFVLDKSRLNSRVVDIIQKRGKGNPGAWEALGTILNLTGSFEEYLVAIDYLPDDPVEIWAKFKDAKKDSRGIMIALGIPTYSPLSSSE